MWKLFKILRNVIKNQFKKYCNKYSKKAVFPQDNIQDILVEINQTAILCKILPYYLFAYFMSRKRRGVVKFGEGGLPWHNKLRTLTFWRTDVAVDLNELDSFAAETYSRTSELVARGWLLRRGHIHTHVIIRKI